jgi:2-oxoglutarate dehydrogenase complex dehydrogenase (E1) component-like enzyme
MGTIEILSLVVSTISTVLAIVAMKLAKSAETEVRTNFQLTKDVLAKIQSESAVVKSTVETSHKALLDTVTHLLNVTLEPPQKPSADDKAKAKIVDFLIKRAETDPNAVDRLAQIAADRRESAGSLIVGGKINKPNNQVEGTQ